jgi:hypothetical protein
MRRVSVSVFRVNWPLARANHMSPGIPVPGRASRAEPEGPSGPLLAACSKPAVIRHVHRGEYAPDIAGTTTIANPVRSVTARRYS